MYKSKLESVAKSMELTAEQYWGFLKTCSSSVLVDNRTYAQTYDELVKRIRFFDIFMKNKPELLIRSIEYDAKKFWKKTRKCNEKNLIKFRAKTLVYEQTAKHLREYIFE